MRSAIGPALRPTDFVLPPLPNQLFTRDTSAWLYGGVSLNPMFWPARQLETLNVEAVYRFHPRFRDAELRDLVRRRRPRLGHGADRGRRHDAGRRRRRPRRHGRAQHGAGRQHARRSNMFAAGAARLVIGAQMPRERAAMHLDTVFTFCDRDVVTLYEPVVSQILPILFRPGGDGGVEAEVSERSFLDEVQDALGIERPEARHDRRRRVRGRAEPVGRRQQRRRARARRRRRATSATRPPTRSSRRPASRCSRSPARSSAAAAAAATA